MKTTTMLMAMLLAPAALLAQGAMGSMQATATSTASARIPTDFSASGRVKLEATYARAREHHVPQEVIDHRVAEGEAKGASEGDIVKSSARVEGNMEAAQEAMVKAGHHPSDKEIEGGAYAMERGVTEAQIQTMAARAPSGRSLDVAFDAVTKLSESGMPVNTALIQVQSKLDAHASDAAIGSLVTKAQGGIKVGGGE